MLSVFKKKIWAVVISAAALSVFIYGFCMEPFNIQVRKITAEPALTPGFMKGIKLLHISDLHMAGIGRNEQQVLDIIGRDAPDLIVLTGDYIQWGADSAPALEFLSKLEAPYGVFAVMGDYDYSNSRQSCLFCHERGSGKPTQQHNVNMLRNSAAQVKIGSRFLQVAGIDPGYVFFDFPKIKKSIKKSMGEKTDATNAFWLILSHSPLSFEQFKSDDRILMLSGDTHGGQIKLPGFIFRILGYEKNVQYNYGLFKEGRKQMVVNAGVGTSHVRFRFLRPPEMVLIQF